VSFARARRRGEAIEKLTYQRLKSVLDVENLLSTFACWCSKRVARITQNNRPNISTTDIEGGLSPEFAPRSSVGASGTLDSSLERHMKMRTSFFDLHHMSERISRSGKSLISSSSRTSDRPILHIWWVSHETDQEAIAGPSPMVDSPPALSDRETVVSARWYRLVILEVCGSKQIA
jgi:hypothetical protein